MTVLVVLLVVALLGASAGMLVMATRLGAAKDAEATAREQAAALNTQIANAATAAAGAAEKRQEQRGDDLEKELASDEATPVGSGLDRLRVVSQAAGVPRVPASSAPSTSGGGGKPR
jgi:Flp pilus assembly protein TadB